MKARATVLSGQKKWPSSMVKPPVELPSSGISTFRKMFLSPSGSMVTNWVTSPVSSASSSARFSCIAASTASGSNASVNAA
jgi:hypothetical protein